MKNQLEAALECCDRLGTRATVVMDRETHSVKVINGEGETSGLRSLEDLFIDGDGSLDLIDEINVVSVWSFHVALYALQNPTEENVARALSLIGTSGDCEEHIDTDTLLPLPVPEPHGWELP